MRTHVVFIALAFLLFAAPHVEAQRNTTQQQKDERLARQLFAAHEYDKAKEVYVGLYSKYGRSDYLYGNVECLLKLKEYDEAEKVLKEAAKKNPSDVRVAVDLCYTYMLRGNNNKSRKAAENLIKNTPDNRNAFAQLGNLFLTRSLFDYALDTYNQGASREAVGYAFRIEKSNVLQHMGRYAESVEQMLMLVDEDGTRYEMVKSHLRQMLYFDVNSNIATEIRTALLRRTHDNPDNENFSALLLWFSLEQKDYEMAVMQCKSLDLRFGNQDRQMLDLAYICFNNKEYALAAEAYEYVYKKGRNGIFYAESASGLIETRYKQAEVDNGCDGLCFAKMNETIDKIIGELGANPSTRNLMIVKAKILAYKLNDYQGSLKLFDEVLNMSLRDSEKASVKLDKADVCLYNDDVWEATLLYSQVDKSMRDDATGHEARFRNARLRYFIGEFHWAEAQLDVLKASTSKLVANDAMKLSLLISENLDCDSAGRQLRQLASADYLVYKNKLSDAVALLDSVASDLECPTAVSHALFQKGVIAERSGDETLADTLFAQVAYVYPESFEADEALMRMAAIREKKGDCEGALRCYGDVIDNYPVSVYMATARKKFRQLREKTKEPWM